MAPQSLKKVEPANIALGAESVSVGSYNLIDGLYQTFYPAQNVIMEGRKYVCFCKEGIESGNGVLKRFAPGSFRTDQNVRPVVDTIGTC